MENTFESKNNVQLDGLVFYCKVTPTKDYTGVEMIVATAIKNNQTNSYSNSQYHPVILTTTDSEAIKTLKQYEKNCKKNTMNQNVPGRVPIWNPIHIEGCIAKTNDEQLIIFSKGNDISFPEIDENFKMRTRTEITGTVTRTMHNPAYAKMYLSFKNPLNDKSEIELPVTFRAEDKIARTVWKEISDEQIEKGQVVSIIAPISSSRYEKLNRETKKPETKFNLTLNADRYKVIELEQTQTQDQKRKPRISIG